MKYMIMNLNKENYMINKSKIISIIYALIFVAIVSMLKREDVLDVTLTLLGPLALIWFGEWFMDNYGGTIVGWLAAGWASFLEGKTIPIFGWFILIFYTLMYFVLPDFTEVV
ncbi:MAG: hypothetical protein JXR69_10650 [Candidatus Delongbacteria bacterium]|nr:hypothetical protein [Candidatus Delongbacteria bacterium]